MPRSLRKTMLISSCWLLVDLMVSVTLEACNCNRWVANMIKDDIILSSWVLSSWPIYLSIFQILCVQYNQSLYILINFHFTIFVQNNYTGFIEIQNSKNKMLLCFQCGEIFLGHSWCFLINLSFIVTNRLLVYFNIFILNIKSSGERNSLRVKLNSKNEH